MPHLSRRDLIAAGAASLTLPSVVKASAPASPVALVRCRSYAAYRTQLAAAFDHIGGIQKLVNGKTVALKLNLTGNPKNFPLTPDLPYRTDGGTVAATVEAFAKAGAKRVRLIESFFPASQEPALWARYGLDVNAINNLGTQVEWENVQNLGNYKKYVRLKVPWGGYLYPAYTINQAYTECDVYASLSKLKNHWIAGVTMSMKNNFGNTPCSLYGSDCGPTATKVPPKSAAMCCTQAKQKRPPVSTLNCIPIRRAIQAIAYRAF